MNYGKIIYNVGHRTCNSNKPKTVTKIENTELYIMANGMRKCRPGKRKRLYAIYNARLLAGVNLSVNSY